MTAPMRPDPARLPVADVPRCVVDTNCVLDLWVFRDPALTSWATAIVEGRAIWLATVPMRDEWVRVLDYPAIQRALVRQGMTTQQALACFDAHACLVPESSDCGIRCDDADDQMFINLAVGHRAVLLSKDAAVLRLRRALADQQVPLGSPFSGRHF